MQKLLSTILLSLLFTLTISGHRATTKPIRVACLGNSVTYGYGLNDREHEAYPVRLGEMLGKGYEVRTFARSGATLLNSGRLPYMTLEEFGEALAYKPDIAVIHLGLNDTDPRNWPNYRDDFIPTYRSLIDSLKAASPNVKIYICLMTPIFERHHRFESGTRDWHEQIQDAIRKVAKGAGAELIDIHTPLYCRSDLFADALHPNAEGAKILAETVHHALTGDYGGLKLPALYTDHAVLQRQKPTTHRGIADAGELITITLTDADSKCVASVTTITGKDGKWTAELPPLEAGGPYRMTFTAKKSAPNAKSKGRITKTITLEDVWLGEVWLASGQSNMVFKVREQESAAQDLTESDLQERLHLYRFKERWLTNDVEWEKSVLDSVNNLQYFDTSDGWQRSGRTSAENFSAIGYHFGRILADSLGCHVGIIENAVGGSPAESWISRHTLEWEYPQILRDWLENDHIQDWVRGRARRNIAKGLTTDVPPRQAHRIYIDPNLTRHPYQPTYLYEAGILPITNYSIRGISWYQGESNAHNAELHERLFGLVVKDLRQAFGGNEQMPFMMMQLSGINRPSWPTFRDSQRRLADCMPNVWMTVTADLGDSLDVHPIVKKPIGERLAANALARVYGFANICPEGPKPLAASIEQSGEVLVNFGYAEGLHTSTGTNPLTFEVAGEDGIFVPCEAHIKGTAVVLHSPLSNPKEVRYGWQPYTRANLVNAAGMPCSTFKIDIKQ